MSLKCCDATKFNAYSKAGNQKFLSLIFIDFLINIQWAVVVVVQENLTGAKVMAVVVRVVATV